MPRTSIVVQLSRIVDKRILPHRNSRSVARSSEVMEVGRYHHARLTSSNATRWSDWKFTITIISPVCLQSCGLYDLGKIFPLVSNTTAKTGKLSQVCAGAFHYYFKSSLERVMRTIVSRHEIDKRFELFNQMFSMNATKLCTQTRC